VATVYERIPRIDRGRYVSGAPTRAQKSPYPFAFARTALRVGVVAAGLRKGDAVLVPEFTYGPLIESLQQLGFRPIYYPVDDQLCPVWGDLEASAHPRLRGLMLVHYFGQPQSVSRAQALCTSRNLLLIEDNAHGFGAVQDGVPLGTRGQVGITSPRKAHPVRNGAYLHLAEGIPFLAPDFPVQRMEWKTPSLGARVRRLAGRIGLVHEETPPDYTSQKDREPRLPDCAMDQETHDYLSARDRDADRRIRQEIYRVWREWAIGRGLTPVFPKLEEGASPLVFPAYTTGHDATRYWFDWGRRHGIDVYSWPTLPRVQVRRGSAAMERWKRLVCFPIHTEMSASELSNQISAG
jgi:hypothetical protein